jgi:hypothetical protein
MKIIEILNNKCPNCLQGNIYNERSIIFNFKKPNMNSHCPNCSFSYNKEPGFFFGALYVSYGLTVAQGILTYIVASFFFERDFDPRIIAIIAFVLIILSTFNMRISRIIWIYLFKNYSK